MGIRRMALVAVGTVSALLCAAGPTQALFIDTATVAANTFSTATLAPPTNPGASASCSGTTRRIIVSWTDSISAFTTGYEVRRSTVSGGPYTTIVTINDGDAVAYTNTGLVGGVTYYYVIRSLAGSSWVSVNTSQVSATAPLVCL